MNAQKIYTYMKEINLTGISLHKDITPECVEPFHKLFDTMRVLEPIDLWRQGEDRFLWIKAPRGSYEEFCESHRSSYIYINLKIMSFLLHLKLQKLGKLFVMVKK